MVVPETKRYRKFCSSTYFAFDPDVTFVNAHQILNQRQTDAGPFGSARLDALDSVEALEQARKVLGLDADTRVTDCQLHLVTHGANDDFNLALKGEFERIRQKIQDDLFPHSMVNIDRLRQLLAAHRKMEPRLLDGGAECACDFLRLGGKVGRLETCFDPPRLDS